MKPNPLSADTAQKLAKQLNIPIEQIMHMPQHVLLKKIAELSSSKSSPNQPTS